MWSLALIVACSSTPDGTDPVSEDPSDDTVDSDTLIDTLPDESDTDPVEDTLPDDPCVTDTPVINVGTGESGFQAVTGGQGLPLWLGGQGDVGFHFFLAVHAVHVPQLVRLSYSVTDKTQGEVIDFEPPDTLNVALVPPVLGQPWDCEGGYWGITARVKSDGYDPDPIDAPEDLCSHEIELSVELRTAADELLGRQSVTVVSRQDVDHLEGCPEWDFCERYPTHEKCRM